MSVVVNPVDIGTCSECGALVLNSARHAEWHRRDLGSRREYSEPLFAWGDDVQVRLTGERGKVVDRWTERGPLHCYTVRFAGAQFKDFLQDELEPVENEATITPLKTG